MKSEIGFYTKTTKNPNDLEKHNRSNSLLRRHPVLTNAVIILAVAVIGIIIVYFSIAIFTHHGQTRTVPGVENKSYTEALQILHDAGLRYEIRDSLFRDDVPPGFVIEQFPKRNSVVKPGRKVFLYINAVNHKKVVIDDDNRPSDYALAGGSERSVLARLEELGFKKVSVVRVLGDNDMVVRILANGVAVRKTQKVPVTASIVVEVSDGRMEALRDSLTNLESGIFPDEVNTDVISEYEEGEEYAPLPGEEASPAYLEPEQTEENNEYLE